jgi:hypothetical protein
MTVILLVADPSTDRISTTWIQRVRIYIIQQNLYFLVKRSIVPFSIYTFYIHDVSSDGSTPVVRRLVVILLRDQILRLMTRVEIKYGTF